MPVFNLSCQDNIKTNCFFDYRVINILEDEGFVLPTELSEFSFFGSSF